MVPAALPVVRRRDRSRGDRARPDHAGQLTGRVTRVLSFVSLCAIWFGSDQDPTWCRWERSGDGKAHAAWAAGRRHAGGRAGSVRGGGSRRGIGSGEYRGAVPVPGRRRPELHHGNGLVGDRLARQQPGSERLPRGQLLRAQRHRHPVRVRRLQQLADDLDERGRVPARAGDQVHLGRGEGLHHELRRPRGDRRQPVRADLQPGGGAQPDRPGGHRRPAALDRPGAPEQARPTR